VRDLGAVFLVDDDAAAVVELDTDLLEAEAAGEGAATDGNEYDVGFDLQERRLVCFRDE
jgi:hypothetical protein